MLIKGKNGQSAARKRQPKSTSSNPKSKRSPVISTGNSESAGDRVLEPGISEDTSGENLSTESVELTAITLHQPWASLIAFGHKQYETRDWPTNYRGPIAIHAGRKPKGKQELREHDKVVASFKDLLNEDCPYSSVIAIAQLTDCVLMTEEFISQQTETELRCGDWKVGRYAFKLENIRAIAPIPAVGKQGLWKWEHRQDWQKKFFGIDDSIKYLDESHSWNSADFGELQHKADADGQLNLLDWLDTEPPEPGDYKSDEEFKKAYKDWAAAQTDEAEEELANFGVDELCNKLISDSHPKTKDWEESSAKGLKIGDRVKENLNNPEWGKTLDCLIKYGEVVSDIYPGKYEPLTLINVQWDDGNTGATQVRFLEKVCNQSTDGSICAQELGLDSPTPGLNCGDDRLTISVNGTATADESLRQDSPESTESTTSRNATSTSAAESNSLQPVLPANPSATRESDSEPATQEIVSPTCSELSDNFNQTSQSLKTLPDSSTVPIPPATNQEPISDLSLTPYPRSGSMLNGKLSAAPTFPAPGVEKDCLLLRSPGGLSFSGETRPPGKNRLETQLNQLGLIQDGEVAAPEFLESGYHLPIGFTNPQENRSAMELSQVQAQQLPIAPKSESPQEMETTAIEGKPSEIAWTGESQQLDYGESNILVSLPPNIGALEKAELISMAKEQHQLICVIERKEFELALEKLHRFRLTGVYLQEFKKKCQYGEFVEQLEQAGIGVRSAQSYMTIAKNWEIVESKAKLVALLTEENQPTIGLKWALEAVRDEKKQLKSAAPPKDPDGWRTPDTRDQPVVSLVKKALGGQIYLDPASDSGCNIPATMRYFKWNDGLAKHNIWEKTVFVNPPFSDPFPWVERCCFEYARGNVSAAIMLLKAGVVSNVGTGELINKYASAICHWRGRINFLNDEGNPIRGSDFDCVLIYFGARLDLFRQNFGGRGTIAIIENHYSSVNKKFLLKSEIPEFGNTQAEQKQLAAAVGLGNGRSVLPDMRDADRERNERYDPHTVIDVLSVPTMPPTVPATPISENLAQPIGEAETLDETPLAVRQFEKAKENCLNDYITAVSGNITEFSDEQLKFLLENINKEVDWRNNQRNDPNFQQRLRQSLLDKLHF